MAWMPMYGPEGGHTPFQNHSESEPSEFHTMISE